MAETTVYTCDICKQSKSGKDLAHITVKSEGISMKGVGFGGITIDICPDCLKKKGFIVELPEKNKDADLAMTKNKATLEDKIYDILQDMNVMFQE